MEMPLLVNGLGKYRMLGTFWHNLWGLFVGLNYVCYLEIHDRTAYVPFIEDIDDVIRE